FRFFFFCTHCCVQLATFPSTSCRVHSLFPGFPDPNYTHWPHSVSTYYTRYIHPLLCSVGYVSTSCRVYNLCFRDFQTQIIHIGLTALVHIIPGTYPVSYVPDYPITIAPPLTSPLA
ncbi:unnamed protein product, partial [Laminaria digitata]